MGAIKPLHEWTDKELAERERIYPLGVDPLHGPSLGAEINRRNNQRNRRYVLASVICAAIAAFGSMIAAIASLLTIYLAHR
jgi:hypothetical protein